MNAALTHAEILALPGPERLWWVEGLRIYYPRWQRLLAQIAFCHTHQPLAAEPPCLLLVGPTGAGKSTLIDYYAAQHPRTVTPETIQQSVLKATITTPATVKSLATVLLYALGDPRYDRGTTNTMTLRVQHFFRDCQVQLLILDELQHFVDRDSERVLLNVSNWLKMVIKETRVACVLIGTQGDAERVVDSNPQLGRLFGDPILLSPFAWDERRPETIQEFRTLLREVEQRLPLREPSQLDQEEMAWRLYVASEGRIGYLMAILRWAAVQVLLAEQEALTLAGLYDAFEARGGGQRRQIANPFGVQLPLRRFG